MISVRIGSVGASPRTVSLASGSTVADALSEGGFSSGVVVKRRGARVDAGTTVNDGDLLVVIGESKTSGALPSKEELEAEVLALRAALKDASEGDVIEVPTPEFIRSGTSCCSKTVIAERGATILDFITSQISSEERILRITDEDGNELNPLMELEEMKYIVTLK